MARIALVLVLASFLLVPSMTSAQFPAPGGQAEPRSEQDAKIERDQAKKRNKQRHEDLKKDTDKLLELATQLKQYVDKSNENILSVEVVKKADEIDKLARSVREKMRGY